jgi:protein-S-isoprenylcysteine O-methyltransferase Ste14
MSDSTRVIATAPNSGVRIFPPGVYLAGLVIGYIIQWFSPIPILPGQAGWVARIAGIALFVAGIFVMLSAVGIFRKIGTPPNPTLPTTALAVDGPYRYTRNPMYLGMALILAGLAGVGNALWPLLALIPVIAFVHTQIIAREEAYLEGKFGDDYRAFKARVRRWI